MMSEEQVKRRMTPQEGQEIEELSDEDLKGVNGGFSTALRLESEILDGAIDNHQNRH